MWKRHKKSILIIAAILLLIGGVIYAAQRPIVLALMERQVLSNMNDDRITMLGDGLHLVLCGAGSPLVDRIRSGPCVFVIAGKFLFVVDAGTNGARNLLRMRWPIGQVDRVFLTHFHSDHIDGLGELAMFRWLQGGHKKPLPVVGPQGVQEIVAGFNRAYRADFGYRHSHHGATIAPKEGAGLSARPFKQPQEGKILVLFDRDGVKVSVFRVNHDPVNPAVGYKFEYKERVIVLSGDTKKSPVVEAMAKGADLLVHEALSPKLVGVITEAARKSGNERLVKITTDILDYHTSPIEAAQTAQAAGVGHLLFYHIVPPLAVRPLEEVFLEGVSDHWDGEITLGRDGTMISLPAGSKEIIVEELL